MSINKIILYNNLTKNLYSFNKSIALISDFKNWNKFEDKLVEDLIKKGKELNKETVLFTTFGEYYFSGIYSQQNIAKKIENLGITRVIFYIKHPLIKNMTLNDLYNDLTKNLNIEYMMVPDNYIDENIAEFNTQNMLLQFKDKSILVESFLKKPQLSLIINELFDSSFDKFKENTGFSYNFNGKVIKGKQLGRTIGFPTINIDVKKAIPLKHGVYGMKVTLKYGKRVFYGAGCYWENSLKQDVFEVNLFNFNEDIYDYEVNLEPLFRLRDNVNFNSVEELKSKLKEDVILIKNKLNIE